MAHVNEMLRTEGLSIGYGKRFVLQNLNQTLRRGELTCIFGANGSGKSTLLRTIAGELSPMSGSITIDGKNLATLPLNQRAKLVSMVYTTSSFPQRLRVVDVVGLGRLPYTGFFGSLARKDVFIMENCVRAVNMTDKWLSDISSLSDGERQKVMIARALAQDTPVILLDEPTSYLDVASRIEIMELLRTLAEKHRKTILFTTHDVAAALRVAHTVWLIQGDGTLDTGSVDDMVKNGRMDILFRDRGLKFDPTLMDYRKDL